MRLKPGRNKEGAGCRGDYTYVMLGNIVSVGRVETWPVALPQIFSPFLTPVCLNSVLEDIKSTSQPESAKKKDVHFILTYT